MIVYHKRRWYLPQLVWKITREMKRENQFYALEYCNVGAKSDKQTTACYFLCCTFVLYKSYQMLIDFESWIGC